MSASKKNKKNGKKPKKLRVETTNNVLSEEEIREKNEGNIEETYANYEGTVSQDTLTKISVNEALKAEDENSLTQEMIKDEDRKIFNLADEKTRVVPTITKELITIPQKDERPEYVREMLLKRKKKMIAFACIAGIILVLILLSTLFAIINSGSTTISKGIKIDNYDVSGLSKEDAKKVVTEGTTKELTPSIYIKSENYETEFFANQIEFEYDIDKAIEEAYNVGKAGNIVQNNYSILFAGLFGKSIDLEYKYNEDLLTSFINETNSNIPGVVIEPAYYIEEDNLYISKGIDGLTIDKEALRDEIIKDLVSRDGLEMNENKYIQTINLSISNVKAQKIDMQKIYEEIHTEPKDAYYETEPYKLYPDSDGIDLAIPATEAQKQVDSEDKEEYTFKLNITKANKTVRDLGLEAFPYLISEFTTKYDASNINRSINLAIAAEKINGTVVLPGEEFSYNKVVGKRTVEEGYKDAKVYQDGGVVDGLAGGICQISSTLYNAVLLANLEVTERHNHTYTTSYLPAGKDATVVWGSKDFKFVNTRSYPIKIEASVKNGIAEFKFHGIAEETEYEIKIIPVVTGSIPFGVEYEDDPSLPFGVERVSQGGHTGCRVTTYKEMRLNGTTISKEVITTDTYSPMRKIVRRGIAGAPEM